MTKFSFSLFSAMIALPVLAGCASNDGEPRVKGIAQFADDVRLGEKVSSACFASRMDGFGETTRDTVVLDFGRDYYLVEVFGVCTNLRSALAIGVDSHGGCLSRGDHLIVSDSIALTGSEMDDGVQRCSVGQIYEWDPKAEAESEAM